MNSSDYGKSLNPLLTHIGLAALELLKQTHSTADDDAKAIFESEYSKMLLGIQKYHIHANEVGQPDDLKTIWQSGEVTLRVLEGHEYKTDSAPILLVPSLINKSHVFHLLRESSMIRYLAGKGLNPYLLDWGRSVADKGQVDMDTLLTQRLGKAVRYLNDLTGRNIYALGYCMGGTLLIGGAHKIQNYLSGMIMLAAPWDFHAEGNALLQQVKFWAPTAMPTLAEKKDLSVRWLQTLFAHLSPEMTAKKFAKFYDMDVTSTQGRLFIAVENWLNDGVSLPAEIARTCIQDWFFLNKPVQKKWVVEGENVDPSRINIPAFIIASDKDRLVNYEMSSILERDIPQAEIYNPSCGHIGMIAGRNAPENVWDKVSEFIAKREL